MGMTAKGLTILLHHSTLLSMFSGPPEKMILIALQGMKGPITVNRKKYNMNLVMPGIKKQS